MSVVGYMAHRQKMLHIPALDVSANFVAICCDCNWTIRFKSTEHISQKLLQRLKK